MNESQVVEIAVDYYAIGAFLAYLMVLIGVGIYSARFSSEGLAEFFIGGRKMNRFVIALSAVVSGRSAWLLLGVSGIAYVRGASAIWAVAGYIIVEFFLFLFYAPRLRRFSEKYDCITVPDFFAERFQDYKGHLRVVLVVIFLLFMVSYVSAQFVAGGKAFASSFGLEQNTGIILSAVIILLYTVLGGFLAVSLTDMLQAFLMIFALVGLPIIALVTGGLTPVLQELHSLDGFVDPFAITAGVFIGFVGIGLGSPGNPHILSRYMAIEDANHLKFAAYVGTAWNVVMAVGAIMVGMIGRYYFPDIDLLPASDTENLYPTLARDQLHPVFFGIVVASIFAAIMSTADSQLLVAASSVVRDVYEKLLKRNEEIPQKTLVNYSRIVVFVLVVIALIIGLGAQELVFWLVLFAWAGLGAAIGPTSILAIFWKGTTKAGVISGLFAGTLTTIVWYYIPVLKENLYELIPAFIVGLVVTYGVSLMTRKPENVEELMDGFEE